MRFERTQLDNGLTIIAEVSDTAASVAMGFFVRTGSRDETPEVAGVSHFLEHMVFKGTSGRSAADVNRAFDELGANYNAFTSEENTVYYGAVLPEYQTPLLDVLGDVLRPAFRQEDFDIEKSVIIDEIARYEDMPRYRVCEKLMAAHFADHPLARSVLGTSESIAAMKREQMQAYFDRRYSPGNVTLVGVGRLDFDALKAKAAQMCSHWRPFDVPRDTPAAPGTRAKQVICDAKVARQHVGLMSPAPPASHEQRFAAHLAAAVFGDVTGSRLYYALIDPALADEAGCTYEAMDGCGAFMTVLSCDADRAPEALQVVRRELRKLRDDGPTEPELEAAKNKLASIQTVKGELPTGRLTAVGFDWIYRGRYVPLNRQIDLLFDVSRCQVHDLINQYDLTAVTTLALGPLEEL